MNHKEYLIEAAKIIDARGGEYGDMPTMHKRIAGIFNLICPDRNLEPHHIALVHMATKLGRLHENPQHKDSVVDLEAYTSFFGELVHGEKPAVKVAMPTPPSPEPTQRRVWEPPTLRKLGPADLAALEEAIADRG